MTSKQNKLKQLSILKRNISTRTKDDLQGVWIGCLQLPGSLSFACNLDCILRKECDKISLNQPPTNTNCDPLEKKLKILLKSNAVALFEYELKNSGE